MYKYKKAKKLESPYLGFVGAMVLLALLSSAGLYAPSFGVQQYQPTQQSASIIVASSNENETITATSSANATTSVANVTTTTIRVPNATLVEFISNIEQIRGHLDQALVNIESGNNTLAQAHVLHPIEEVYSSIEDQLANQNSTLNQTLSVALHSLSSNVTNATLQQFESQTDYVNTLLNNSVKTVVPTSELERNPAFNTSVVARLLHAAGHEYEEAVANGTVKAIVEYQDAQAFIYGAESIFNSSTSRINQSMAPEVEEVHELFLNLNGAVNNKGDPQTVETTINGIIHVLAEITDLSDSQLVGEGTRAAEQDPIAIINNIKSLLNQQLLSAYRSQDYEGAESIAIEAYLENYENVEEPIAQHDPVLMEQTEVMLREELRQMIRDRVPVEQIQQQVAMINANLDKATELLQ
jgi:hypothetical protein